MSFTRVLENAGKSFLRAFGANIIVLAPGIAAAPNLDGAVALGIAGIAASIASGLRALQDIVPQLQITWYYKGVDVGSYIGSFARAAIGSAITGLLGILTLPTLSFTTSIVWGLLSGAIAAGFLGLQKAADKKPLATEQPSPPPPPPSPSPPPGG